MCEWGVGVVVSFLRFCKRVEVEVVCYLFILQMGEMLGRGVGWGVGCKWVFIN